MQAVVNTIIRHYFGNDHPDEVAEEELKNFLEDYPFSGVARLLQASHAIRNGAAKNDNNVLTATLYFHNPLWLDMSLQEIKAEPANISEDITVADGASSAGPDNEAQQAGMVAQSGAAATPDESLKSSETAQTKKEEPGEIAFQSYHTIDYFASQGIRLQQADLTRDRLGQQLKSFTEWLRSMKKLPATETAVAGSADDEVKQQHVIRDAAESIQEKEVLTEAMAEVWWKQGNLGRAREIYEKLSLQNPAKSAYFAAKIDQLK